jgi:hypothetical protein
MNARSVLQRRVVKLGWDIRGGRKMRFAVFIVFVIAALWLGDVFFFKGRYTNEAWVEASKQMRDFNYAVRRWTRF